MSLLSDAFKKSKASLGRDACDAAFQGDFAKAFALINKGGDINISRFIEGGPGGTSGEGNIGHAALRHDNIEALEMALERGLKVNFHSPYRGPMLEVAIENGQTAAAKLLIKHGAEIRTAPDGRFNALTLAKIQKNQELIEFIEDELNPGRAKKPAPVPPPLPAVELQPTERAIKPLKPVAFKKP